MPVQWIVLFISVYGFQKFWNIMNKNQRIPGPIIVTFQIIIVLSFLVWIITVMPYVPKIAKISPPSRSMPYIALALIAAIFTARRFAYEFRGFLRDLTITAVTCLLVISNHFLLVRVVGNGRVDVEFKILADWYRDNAGPDEKLVTTFAGTLAIFLPQFENNFIHNSDLTSENQAEFIKKCYEHNVTYIAWDSRKGLKQRDRRYKLWRLDNIAALANQQNAGPFEYINSIRVSKRRFINIFRLNKADASAPGLPS